MALKPLFKQPFGASSRCTTAGDIESVCSEVIICELCGTKYPKYENNSDNSDYYFHFLGYRGIKQCCGKVIDILYQQWGRDFFERTLSEVKNNPHSIDNIFSRDDIKNISAIFALLQQKSKNTNEA